MILRGLQRVRRAQQERGWVGMLIYAVRHRLPIYKTLVYRSHSPCELSYEPGFTVARYSQKPVLDEATLQQLSRYGGGLAPELDKLFAQGCELWLGRLGSSVVGFCWSRHGVRRTDYFVPLKESDAGILSCLVFPGHRGRGFYPAMLRTVVKTLMTQDDVQCVYIDCRAWNYPSVRGIQKAGFLPLGSGVRLSVFGHTWIVSNRCVLPSASYGRSRSGVAGDT